MNPKYTLLRILVAMITLAPKLLRADDVTAPTVQTHQVQGIIRRIAPDRSKLLVRHEAIPDYMPAMTMQFNVREPKEALSLSVGDAISFRLNVKDGTHWIDQIQRTAASVGPASPEKPDPRAPIGELKPGDLVPDFDLIGENGKPVRFSDFRGQALAFTFFFTRCPLPDYCPRMNSNFAKGCEFVRRADPTATNWHFLSISFDQEFDKPSVVASYAGLYRQGRDEHWSFATAPGAALAKLAPLLDLMIRRDSGGGISHNLRTVVLDPQGRIYRQFDGNDWKPEDLVQSLLEAARTPDAR